jgi:hypothetical protein
MAARYATDTFTVQLASGASHLVQKGSLRDSTHEAVLKNSAAFTATAPVAGRDVDGKTSGRLTVYPAGTEL